MHHEQVGIARAQEVGADADRRHGKEGVGCSIHRVGQLHAANAVILRRAEHARRRVGVVGVLRRLRQDDFLSVELRLLLVHRAVEWRVLLARNALAGVEHGIKGLARVIGKALARVERFGLEPVVQQEIVGGA